MTALRTAATLVLVAMLAASCSDDGTDAGATTTAAPGSATPTTTAPTPGTAASASPGCEAPEGAGGSDLTKGEPTDETITSSDVDRTYLRFVPTSYTGTTSVPLVIDLHGYQEGAAIHATLTDLNSTAEREGFVNLTPQGTSAQPFWNAVPTEEGPKDLQFVSDLIDQTGEELCIDLTRVYVTGFSNGAFLSSLIACRMADEVAAIAPVAGLLVPDDCEPTRPMPIIAFHGEADEFVSYATPGPGPKGRSEVLDQDTQADLTGFGELPFQPIPESLAWWADNEGCASPASETPVAPSVTLIRYEGCRDGSVVELYAAEGAGHTWPGSEFSQAIENAVGPTTLEIDANELMWAFFSAHRLPA
jgi:polyhydroxybutyrate depolymerase